MKQLHFSVAEPRDAGMFESFFSRLVAPTMASSQTSLSIEAVVWDMMWQFVKNKTFSRSGLDVSEVGTTWVATIADAQGLRPFSDDFVTDLGGINSFVESAWKSACVLNDTRVLSIPWLVDVRVVYYWRDLLEDAGVDENRAFSSIAETRETMEKLRAAGLPGWGAPTFGCHNQIYNVAPWLWANNGRYVREDGRRTSFCSPEALEAITAYFQLFEHLPRPFESFSAVQNAFANREVAATVEGPWMWVDMFEGRTQKVDIGKVGVALPPGPPFIGGSNLIVWSHMDTILVDEAQLLIKTLSSPELQAAIHRVKRLLPVHREAYGEAPFTTDDNYKVLGKAVALGRHLPSIPMWGHMEESLVRAFGLICESLKNSDFTMKDNLAARHLEPLARRFDRTLSIF